MERSARLNRDSSSFFSKVKKIIKEIPAGKVASYGQIAFYAGNARAARQVAWVLHTSSKSDNLPWHRVINGQGRISLKPGLGYELQRSLLEAEGVTFNDADQVDLDRYGFRMRETDRLV
jgi:methylated-DNA-protein-cysteine methyltransferase-like protein